MSTRFPVTWIVTTLIIGAPLAAPVDAPPILQQVHIEAEEVRAADPALARDLMALQPLPTRARMPRFQSELFLQPDAHWVLGERLLEAGDSPEVRAALVHAYASLPGAEPGLLLHLAKTDQDPQIRGAAVTALARGNTPQGLSAVRLGMEDSSSQVRQLAVSAAGYRADGLSLATDLVSALSDTDASVRAFAARTLAHGSHCVPFFRTPPGMCGSMPCVPCERWITPEPQPFPSWTNSSTTRTSESQLSLALCSFSHAWEVDRIVARWVEPGYPRLPIQGFP